MTSQALERPSRRDAGALRRQLESLEREAGANALAVSVYDTESGEEFGLQPDRWFHAASTIKVAILLGVFGAFHRGALFPQSRVHVRNRFASAFDGQSFRVESDRDANSAVHESIGKTMRVAELAHHMIVTSSNLATNLLLDLVGVEAVQRTLDQFDIEGIDVRRGVEDERAFEHGINNRVTARGLSSLLRLVVEGRAFTPELSEGMLDILHAQEFRSGIPAQLPKGARVANKTGEISTIAHDAGVVYPPDRRPYVVVVLTEWDPEAGRRMSLIARASRAVYDYITGEDDA
ncbi:MAG TPA: serine hydrolase [Gemmatimonadaceae bacterium]|nr:serine hydrolase [Gemmatimonadaceae bacterium]